MNTKVLHLRINEQANDPESPDYVKEGLKCIKNETIKEKVLKFSSTNQHDSFSETNNHQNSLITNNIGREKVILPNSIAHSNLFAPIGSRKRGKNIFHIEKKLHSRSDVEIIYSGAQLSEPQCDILMHLLIIANKHPLGEPIKLVRGGVLKSVGINPDGRSYNWLNKTMLELLNAEIKVKAFRKNKTSVKFVAPEPGLDKFTILTQYITTPDSNYSFAISPNWAKLFDNNEFIIIDQNIRNKIPRSDHLAKALHRLIATSKDKHQIHSLQHLRELALHSGTISDFKRALRKSCNKLIKADILAGHQFGFFKDGRENLELYIKTK